MSDKHYYQTRDSKHDRRHGSQRINTWLLIGVGILVILLVIWLTVADLTGNTDVAAYIPLR